MAPGGGLTTGRSILSAAILTRVATRSAGKVGFAVAGAADPIGGSVSSGEGLAWPTSNDGRSDARGPASTGVV